MYTCVENQIVSVSFTLSKNETIEHYIRVKTYKSIVLRFWIESVVNPCIKSHNRITSQVSES